MSDQPPAHLRYHEVQLHLAAPFGSDWFGQKAESFARVFGTPAFLLAQTMVVIAWIAVNAVGFAFRWDPYPFILLNLAFSTQAAYAAPLILLAQTREADRDKALALADAKHRDAIAQAAAAHADQLRLLLESNTRLTEESRRIAVELERLTRSIHARVYAERAA